MSLKIISKTIKKAKKIKYLNFTGFLKISKMKSISVLSMAENNKILKGAKLMNVSGSTSIDE
ncbi:MAG: hypothetical protein ACK5KR_07395 [Breznakia sp.]